MAGEGPRRRAESARRGPGGGRFTGSAYSSPRVVKPTVHSRSVRQAVRCSGEPVSSPGRYRTRPRSFSESFELRRELGDDRASLAIVLGWAPTGSKHFGATAAGSPSRRLSTSLSTRSSRSRLPDDEVPHPGAQRSAASVPVPQPPTASAASTVASSSSHDTSKSSRSKPRTKH